MGLASRLPSIRRRATVQEMKEGPARSRSAPATSWIPLVAKIDGRGAVGVVFQVLVFRAEHKTIHRIRVKEVFGVIHRQRPKAPHRRKLRLRESNGIGRFTYKLLRLFQRTPPLALGQQGETIIELGLGKRRGEEAVISCDHSDSNTLAEGFGRKASDKTFVSRTIIRNLGAHALVRVLAGTFLRRQRFDSPSDRIGQVFVGGGVLSKHRAQDVAHFVLHRTVPVSGRTRNSSGLHPDCG